ncbi:MAG: gamma-glutamylcyclotransferase [Erysipelotrichaceae bacterium]|nr:gamma-glutamylcyclotransferase [Erysipelotrichaceae bacterium]MDY5251209.1 gamma-glutamylcyclotransferase family protein [Erysipelotrichaceae bacterium]
MTNYLFVYGSLRHQQENHHFLQAATYINEGYVQGSLYTLKDASYPAFIPQGQRMIKGEIYQVDDADLKLCDTLEEYDPSDLCHSEYLRYPYAIYDQNGHFLFEAYTYVYNPNLHTNLANLIEENDFVAYLNKVKRCSA